MEAGEKIHLDANESFLPVPQKLLEEFQKAMGEIPFHRYPDPEARLVCQAFADHYGIPAENTAAGNGSDELITVLFSGFLEKGDAFATIEPDFSMYAVNGEIQEARHVAIPKGKDFTLDVDRTIEICNNEKVKLLIFSNPCNPTSLVLPREEVRRLVSGVKALVVLDEAYMDFSTESMLPEFQRYDNLVILRTCSKAIGMAALRLGFAVAGHPVIDAIKAVKSPYNVNAVTQALGTQVLNRKRLLKEALETILRSRDELRAGVEKIGRNYPGIFTLLPGETNFLAFVLENPQKLCEFLDQKGIVVRFTGGLVRVTCGTKEENAAFLKALEEYCGL